MRHHTCRWAIAIALGSACAAAPTVAHADGPGLFGRLFKKKEARNANPAPRPNGLPAMARPAPGAAGSGPDSRDPGAQPEGSLPFTNAEPAPAEPADAPQARSPRPAAPAVPSRPITEADPLLTRVSLIRGDQGQRYGVFLQIYTDGTVLDSQGLHRLQRAEMAPIIQAVQACDVTQRSAHCGGQSSDYLEAVQFVVHDRSNGKLRAHAFSCSGDIRSCDPGLQRLQMVLDELMTKFSATPDGGPASPTPVASGPIISTPAGGGPALPISSAPGDSEQLQVPIVPGADTAPPPPFVPPAGDAAGAGDSASAPAGGLPPLTPPSPNAPQP